MPGKPNSKHKITSFYENVIVNENERKQNSNIIQKQLLNQKREMKSPGSIENVYKGVKQEKLLLETDFPVIELKPTEPFKKSSIPSEQIKMNWLQNKGKLLLTLPIFGWKIFVVLLIFSLGRYL